MLNREKTYYVYIMTNQPRGTLYIGITNDFQRRVLEHRNGLSDGFTKKYALHTLVYVQEFIYVNDAISYEKKLKRWHREWKLNLIEENNPLWQDLYDLYFK